MKRLVCLVLLILSLASAYALDEPLDLVAYVEWFVAEAGEIQDQLDRVGSLEIELETARIRKDSALAIELAKIELEAAKMKIREVENAAALNAVSLFIGYVQADRDAIDANAALAIAEEEYAVVLNRFRADEQTEREVLNHRISMLQSRKNATNAAFRLEQATRELMRPIELETVEFDNDLSSVTVGAVVLESDTVKQNSSDYYLAFETQALRQRERALKSGSTAFTRDEIETLEDQLREAADQLEAIGWDIEDAVNTFESDMVVHLADVEIAEITLALARIDLDSLSLQYEYGDVLESVVKSGKRQVTRALHDLETLEEALLQMRLEAIDLSGGDVAAEITPAS